VVEAIGLRASSRAPSTSAPTSVSRCGVCACSFAAANWRSSSKRFFCPWKRPANNSRRGPGPAGFVSRGENAAVSTPLAMTRTAIGSARLDISAKPREFATTTLAARMEARRTGAMAFCNAASDASSAQSLRHVMHSTHPLISATRIRTSSCTRRGSGLAHTAASFALTASTKWGTRPNARVTSGPSPSAISIRGIPHCATEHTVTRTLAQSPTADKKPRG
jgi:hypothetical protein